MDDGFAFFVLWMSVILGFFGMLQLYRMTVLSWAERQWRLTREPIHFGPVGATCYGTDPAGSYRGREGHYGAVGIVGEQFVFYTRNYERVPMPLASITWIGERQITVSNGKGTKKVTALMVHGEYQHDWFVIALSSNEILRHRAAVERALQPARGRARRPQRESRSRQCDTRHAGYLRGVARRHPRAVVPGSGSPVVCRSGSLG